VHTEILPHSYDKKPSSFIDEEPKLLKRKLRNHQKASSEKPSEETHKSNTVEESKVECEEEAYEADEVDEDEIEYASDDVGEEASDSDDGVKVARHKTKAVQKARKCQSNQKQQELFADEDADKDENVFIDNLPDTVNGINSLLTKVHTHSEALEKAFLVDENSDDEAKNMVDRE
jgi:hypothetical protein